MTSWRCARLQSRIKETLELIDGFDGQLLLSRDPAERQHAAQEIRRLKTALNEYENEYRTLDCRSLSDLSTPAPSSAPTSTRTSGSPTNSGYDGNQGNQWGRVSSLAILGLILLVGIVVIFPLITNRLPAPTPTMDAAARQPHPTPFTPPPAPTQTAMPSVTPWPIVNGTTYSGQPDQCSISVSPSPELEHPNSLRLTFNPSVPGSFCGWMVIFPDHYDASKKSALSFWVRGDRGGEQFEVGIKDRKTPPGQEPKEPVSARPQWRHVSIPLTHFSATRAGLSSPQDLSALENVSLNFVFQLGSGAIYVDNFAFDAP